MTGLSNVCEGIWVDGSYENLITYVVTRMIS